MKDLETGEALSLQTDIDINTNMNTNSDVTSLRKRKNTNAVTNASANAYTNINNTAQTVYNKERILKNQNLVRRINRTDDDDDDAETKEFKEAIMKQQLESNKQMAKAQMNLLVFLFVFVFSLYLYLHLSSSSSSSGDADADDDDDDGFDFGNRSSLMKALGILLGMNRHRGGTRLPRGAKVVAFTSISKNTLEEYTYPTWNWNWNQNLPWRTSSMSGESGSSSSSSSLSFWNTQYLVPATEEGTPVQNLFHRLTKIKAERGIRVHLYDSNEIEEFFTSSPSAEKCENVIQKNSENSNVTLNNGHPNQSLISDQYRQLGMAGLKDVQKMLWVWCKMYTGEAYGFVDLDVYEVHLGHLLIDGLIKKKIGNVLIDGRTRSINMNGNTNTNVDVDVDADAGVDAASLTTSIMFMPNQNSNVAEGMLKYFMNMEISDQDDGSSTLPSRTLLTDSVEHLHALVQLESESWTLLRANCGGKESRWPLGNLCDSNGLCCDVNLRKNKS